MIIIKDTNEFHPLEGGTGPCIIRTGYSTTHVDKAWGTDAPKANAQPWWGAYHYLAQNDDPVAAADFMLSILAGWRPNVLCCDDEEGGGDQAPRVAAFCGRLHEVITDIPDWDYSGLYFARNHDLKPEWLAAYQGTEPSDAHRLWQYTDKQQFDGMSVPCDASQFDGTLEELIALTGGNVLVTNEEMDQIAQKTAALIVGPIDNALKAVTGNPHHTDSEYTPVGDQTQEILAAVHALQGGGSGGGGLSETQVRAIIREELNKTTLHG